MTTIIEQFRKKFVKPIDSKLRAMNLNSEPCVMGTTKNVEAFILKALKEKDKKHFFEMEELRMKEGGLRIKQHKIYDEKLKTQRESIIKEIERYKEATNCTGTFKYDDVYDECIEIINNIK